MRKPKQGTCIGFGDREGVCRNEAGTPWTPLWCNACDEERRQTISEQLAEIQREFDRRTASGKEELT